MPPPKFKVESRPITSKALIALAVFVSLLSYFVGLYMLLQREHYGTTNAIVTLLWALFLSFHVAKSLRRQPNRH